MKSSKNTSIPLQKYLLSTAWRRLFSRIVDLIITTGLIVGLSIAILITDKNFDWKNQQLNQKIYYFLISLLVIIIFFLFFIFIPMFNNKQTLGMKIFKLKYQFISQDKNNFFLSLLKHELFIWILMAIVSMTIGITFSCINIKDFNSLNNGIAGFSKNNSDSFFYYLGLCFKTLYYICFIVLFAIIINLFVKNKQLAFHDKFSNLCVIMFVKKGAKQRSNHKSENNSIKINHGLPGEVDATTLDQLESSN